MEFHQNRRILLHSSPPQTGTSNRHLKIGTSKQQPQNRHLKQAPQNRHLKQAPQKSSLKTGIHFGGHFGGHFGRSFSEVIWEVILGGHSGRSFFGGAALTTQPCDCCTPTQGPTPGDRRAPHDPMQMSHSHILNF